MKIKKVIYWLLIILFLPITIWFILFKLIWKCRWNKFIKVIASIGVVVIGLIVCSNIGDSEKQITENTYNQTSTSDSLAEVEETTQKITTTTTKQTSITSSTTTQTTTSSTTITTTTTRTTSQTTTTTVSTTTTTTTTITVVVIETEEEYDYRQDVIVYKTKTGECYHYENPCGRGEYYECTLQEAIDKYGLKACDKCVN